MREKNSNLYYKLLSSSATSNSFCEQNDFWVRLLIKTREESERERHWNSRKIGLRFPSFAVLNNACARGWMKTHGNWRKDNQGKGEHGVWK